MKTEVIYGPPGTGKTTYLKKIAEESKFPVLFLSFTKAAAKEATSRLNNPNIQISTIHSLAFKCGSFSKDQVIDQEKLMTFANKTGIPMTGKAVDSDAHIEEGDELYAIYNLAICRCESFEETYNRSSRPSYDSVFRFFINSYENFKRENGFIDFNDMLVNFPENTNVCVGKTVIIDEGQDLSKLQWNVIEKIIPGAESVHIAGDDDQAIYTWGGADPAGMVVFEKKHKSKRTILTQSYRIPKSVHDLSINIISDVKVRVEKEYKPTKKQGKVVRHGSINSLSFDDRDTLILYRSHFFRKEIERNLWENNIPYVVEAGKPGIYQLRIFTAIQAILKLQNNNNITDKEYRCVLHHIRSDFKKAWINRNFKIVHAYNYKTLLKSPWIDHFNGCDFNKKPNVRLSTIHSSKGTEAERVILLTNLSNRIIDNMFNDKDAETRVFYVAATRAKDQLDIVEGDVGFRI